VVIDIPRLSAPVFDLETTPFPGRCRGRRRRRYGRECRLQEPHKCRDDQARHRCRA